jgi:hypothetical protein
VSVEVLIANEGLTRLPDSIASLTSLRTLDAGHNQIAEVGGCRRSAIFSTCTTIGSVRSRSRVSAG